MRWAQSGSRGRRITEDVEVSKRVRHYDPEDARQRRRGMGIAAAAIGGAAAVRSGARGIKASTQLARRGHPFAPYQGARAGYLHEAGEGKKAMRFTEIPESRLKHAQALRRDGITARPGDIARVAGGGALLGGAGKAQYDSTHPRNARWR